MRNAPDQRSSLYSVVDKIVTDGADDKTIGRARTLVGRSPALGASERLLLLRALDTADRNGPSTARGELDLLARLDTTPTLVRSPVVFPPLSVAQTRIWHTLVDLDTVGVPWVLVGGNMVTLHCLEHGRQRVRTTNDGDIVVDVWTSQTSLQTVTRHLIDHGYAETGAEDALGFDQGQRVGFKYLREDSRIDVLIPENTDRQRRRPKTASGSDGMAVAGANRALIRAQRVPVDVAGVIGHVRRPHLTGAVTIKVRAALADKNPSRHLQDLAELLAVVQPLRWDVVQEVADKDRHWYRRLLAREGRLEQPAARQVLEFLVDPAYVG